MIINSVISGGGSNVDLSVVTAAAGDVRSSKNFVDSSGTTVTGTLTDNGAYTGTISDKNALSIPDGIHSGSTVQISTTEANKIIASNIKSGVSILGVTGSLTTGYTINGTQHSATVLLGLTISAGDFVEYYYNSYDSSYYVGTVGTSMSGVTLYPAVAITSGSSQETIDIIGYN